MNYIYQDILIENADVVLDTANNPVLIQDRAVIAQDVKHAIIESNLHVLLVGDRSVTSRSDVIKQIELLVEQDTRLVPGTTQIEEPMLGTLWIFSETVEFGLLQVEINNV